MFNTVFIDLDGTLTDSAPGIVNSIVYALEKMGYEDIDRDLLRRYFIGPPLGESFAKYYGMSKEEGWKGVLLYREYFNVKGAFENSVYPGVEDMLKKLKAAGKRLIVATSKPEDFSIRIIEHFGLSEYFEFVAGADLLETRNTKDRVLKYAIERAGLEDLSDVVMLGDRRHDVEGAAAVGIPCIGVLYGYGTREELEQAGAAVIVQTPEDVVKYIIGE